MLAFLALILVVLVAAMPVLSQQEKNSEQTLAQNKVAFYMWGMKPDEDKPCPRGSIEHNNQYVPGQIVGPTDIEPLVQRYHNPELAELWQHVPKWIVKADLGRLLYLYYHGGFYFDIDCKIKRDFFHHLHQDTILFTESILDCTSRLGPREIKDDSHKLRIANYALGSLIQQNPFYGQCLEECIRRLKILLHEGDDINNLDVLWVCGPDVITTVYHRLSPADKDNTLLLPEQTVENENLGSWR